MSFLRSKKGSLVILAVNTVWFVLFLSDGHYSLAALAFVAVVLGAVTYIYERK